MDILSSAIAGIIYAATRPPLATPIRYRVTFRDWSRAVPALLGGWRFTGEMRFGAVALRPGAVNRCKPVMRRG